MMKSVEKSFGPAYFAAGVFKLDYKVAGYPELKRLAQEWAKDSNFHELLVRHVSESNFGIQFVYVSNQECRSLVKQLREELEHRFGKVYAIDCEELTASRSGSNLCDGVVVLKPLSSVGA